jgi:hypothetical protein
LFSLESAGLVERGPGAAGFVRRIDTAAVVTRTNHRGPTRTDIIDEWDDTKDWPVVSDADAKVARIKEVRHRAKRARLMVVLGQDG